jgi:hypothetical protein
MASGDQRSGLKAQILERLHNPVQLRAFITALVLLGGYAGIYMPLSDGIQETTRKLAKEKKHLDLARDIEHLRAQYENFKHRVPDKSDSNEWVRYVLGGVRRFPLKLATLDSEPVRNVGPYKAVVLRIELEGAFLDMNGFLGWLETNERLFRIDAVRIQPHRSGNGLVMQLTVLGVMS